jgi:hypothetical protein
MILTREKLNTLDEAYREYNRKSVNFLVKELRKLRKSVQEGEEIKIEGSEKTLKTFSDFYFWADDRYPALEDDPKVEWIGMD